MSSNADLNELRQDLAEYEQLQKTAKRPKVQEMLLKEMDRLRRDVLSLEAHEAKVSGTAASSGANRPKGYIENLTNYAWDQSDKFMKLYLTLDNLGAVTEENVAKEFTEKSVTVKVQFPNKVIQLHIARLCEEIIPGDCYVKKKSDYVLVMLKKAEAGKTWPWVTEREKKTKEKDKPKMDGGAGDDPSAGITSMLKNMYDEGDDEMKRSISKAFYESQMKQMQGGGGDAMPDFG